jgi:CMP-N,N'-diacetyllegionaminic acid synthase
VSAPSVLLAIPARGGSKRLKRKNLATLGGKPMLSYTIAAAIGAGLSDEVFVCTEDAEIAAISTACGAVVFPISESMADDEVSSTVPCLALYESLSRSGRVPEFIFNLQPSSPLRSSEDIRAAFQIFVASDRDFLVSVTPIDPHYFHWAMKRQEDGWGMFFGDRFLKERTKLEPVFRPNGAIKLALSSALVRFGHFFGPRLGIYEMPEHRAIHVATAFDLTCAEAVLQHDCADR